MAETILKARQLGADTSMDLGHAVGVALHLNLTYFLRDYPMLSLGGDLTVGWFPRDGMWPDCGFATIE